MLHQVRRLLYPLVRHQRYPPQKILGSAPDLIRNATKHEAQGASQQRKIAPSLQSPFECYRAIFLFPADKWRASQLSVVECHGFPVPFGESHGLL